MDNRTIIAIEKIGVLRFVDVAKRKGILIRSKPNVTLALKTPSKIANVFCRCGSKGDAIKVMKRNMDALIAKPNPANNTDVLILVIKNPAISSQIPCAILSCLNKKNAFRGIYLVAKARSLLKSLVCRDA